MLITGADPVAVLVRRDGAECICPADPLNGSVVGDLVELLLSRRIVFRFRVEDFRGAGVGGVFDEHGDRDACARTRFEHVSAFASTALTGRSCVPLQVVDEDLRELIL